MSIDAPVVGRGRADVEVVPALLSPYGVLHGAGLFAMIDAAMGAATMSLLEEGTRGSQSDLWLLHRSRTLTMSHRKSSFGTPFDAYGGFYGSRAMVASVVCFLVFAVLFDEIAGYTYHERCSSGPAEAFDEMGDSVDPTVDGVLLARRQVEFLSLQLHRNLRKRFGPLGYERPFVLPFDEGPEK